MDIDLTDLSKNHAILLNKIIFKSQNLFLELLNKIYFQSSQKKKILFSNLFSRDIMHGSFFHSISILIFLDEILKKKKINNLFLDNKVLIKIIKKKYPHLNLIYKNTSDEIGVIKKFFILLSYILKLMISKDTSRRLQLKKLDNIKLFETFLIDNMFSDDKNFEERYTLNLKHNFDKNDNIIFFSNFLLNKNINKKIFLAKKKLKNIILISDYFNIIDYLSLITKSFFINNKTELFFKRYDLKDLVDYHFKKDNFDLSLFMANANYLFFKKLKQDKVNLSLVIDWYENQKIDKGFNLGKNTFFPKVKSKGYVGFVNDFSTLFHYTPSYLEEKNKLLPNEILVTGKKIKPYFRRFNDNLKVKVVPAMRNLDFYKKKKSHNYKKNYQTNVLIVLSSDNNEMRHILNILENLDKSIFKSFKLKIKPHVMTDLIELRKRKNNKIIISFDKLPNLLESSKYIILGRTTDRFDALFKRKKISIIGMNNGLTINPLNIGSFKKYFNICYSSKDYEKFLKETLSYEKNIKKLDVKKNMSNFFQNFNKHNFNNFKN